MAMHERAGASGRILGLVIACAMVVACNEAPAPSPTTDDPDVGLRGTLRPGALRSPAGSVTPRPVARTPEPTPAPTPIRYRIRRGDTLAAIARRFGVPWRRIMRFNDNITDPNRIQEGQVIYIPPRGVRGPAEVPLSQDSIQDDESDGVDESGRLVQTPGYVDIHLFEARATARELTVSLTLLGVPPALSPNIEQVTYRIILDTTESGTPDWILLYGNTLASGTRYGVSLEDRRRGRTRRGQNVPGQVQVVGSTIRWRVPLNALGNPEFIRLAARAERVFQPDRPGTRRVIDDAPRPQWPERSPQWLEIVVP
jgi:LysM repeat protein